ncbi:MAG: bifunctional metallophosphatase/5'-nucleotidase [Bacteroidales bacterium]|nr:bifunctional metallophosphatase/5'-nucleotidase [Bacteroidales bacterium]
MKNRILFAVTLLGLTLSFSCGRKSPTTFVVLQTTDLHGVLGSEMSSLAGYIKDMQSKHGSNLLLFDGGDNFQGTPQVFFANYIDTTSEHIYSRLFNWLSYDAITPGNHDLEVGRKVYDKIYAEMKMPIISTNILEDQTGEPYFKPYTVLKRGGWKIAVMGLLTPYATEWFPDHIQGGVTVGNPEQAAAQWVRKIYEKEKPDLLIGLFHAGWGEVEGRDTSESAASIGAWIAYNIPGFDLICCGHVHAVETGYLVNKAGDTVHMLEAGARAGHIGRADIKLEPRKNKKPKVTIATQVIPTREMSEYPPYDKVVSKFMERENEYNSEECCVLLQSVYSRDAMFGPSAWIDEQHRIQLSAANSGTAAVTGAVISFASPAARNLVLYAGQLQVKDFITALPYENTLSVVRMTGQEIIEYLDYAHSLRLDNPDGPAYNFDSAAGILYRVERHEPPGARIKVLSMADGSPFYANEEYHVVMSTFRARGGGGHMTEVLGMSPEELYDRILWVSETDVRAMYKESMVARKEIRLSPLYHWRYL